MSKKITIQLVDDHEMVRTAFRYMLESGSNFNVIVESRDGQAAISDYARVRPDIILMDIFMPGMSGLDATRHILAKVPDAKIIVLSMLGCDVAVRAMGAGARGYVCKSSAAAELHTAIHRVMKGQTYIDSEIAQEMALSPTQSGGPLEILSAREYEVFVHLANGISVNVIATRCCLSPKTVRSHKSHIMRKLDLNNTVDFVRLAMKAGVILRDH